MSVMILQQIFWCSMGLVFYTYICYPIAIGLAARWRSRPIRPVGGEAPLVSFITAAHNEEKYVERRLAELSALLLRSGRRGEIIIVSDGSTDRTVDRARRAAGPFVRVLELPQNVGKSAALNAGYKAARHPILVFSDFRQSWAQDSLQRLVENFADASVGAVSGNLVLESSPGVMAGVGLYWRFEKWIRRKESRFHSMIGVSGSICAVRRNLYHPIPPGTILDDVYWPMQVVMQGFRVVYDENAVALDHLPDRTQDEFRRKVRTLSGNYQLLTRLPRALSPWHNPVWVQFLSHKLLRLAVPWALLFSLMSSAFLESPLYCAAFWSQILMYVLGLAGMHKQVASRVRFASATASFLVLNAAAWLAFWVWITGRASGSWRKTVYREVNAPSSERLDAVMHHDTVSTRGVSSHSARQ
jgi:poly-beta-1,6-N-acetyl-D-glucosamine synthase